MNLRDPKLIALLFNECINNRDIDGLGALMTEDHTFVDRDGAAHGPKQAMVEGWKQFFEQFPEYRNTFDRIESRQSGVVIHGSAYWSDKEPYDPVIWSATIAGNRVREWCVHVDTEANRKRFNLE
jgi:hypothetical protein